MKRYRVVQGYEGTILYEVNRFGSKSEATNCYDNIKKDINGLEGHGCLYTQIRVYYDDERGGYLENEESIACYEYHY